MGLKDIVGKAKEVAGRLKGKVNEAVMRQRPGVKARLAKNEARMAAKNSSGGAMAKHPNSDQILHDRASKKRGRMAAAGAGAAALAGGGLMLARARRAAEAAKPMNRAKAAVGSAVSKIRSMTHGQKAAAGATAAAVGGLTLLRKKKDKKRK